MCAATATATVNNGGRRKSIHFVDQWASINFYFLFF